MCGEETKNLRILKGSAWVYDRVYLVPFLPNMSFNSAVILDYLHFLFRSLQPNEPRGKMSSFIICTLCTAQSAGVLHDYWTIGRSVADPWHFGSVADADPLANGSEYRSEMPKTYGSGSETPVHLHHLSKDKKSKRSHKTVENKVFLTFFAWWWNIRSQSRIQTCD